MDPSAKPRTRKLKRVKLHVAHAVISLFRRLPASTRRGAVDFAQSFEYCSWVVETFGADSAFFPTREKLWAKMLPLLRPDSHVTVFEFVVAYGYSTRWWLSRSPLIDRCRGFGTFIGLPQPWRHFAQGAFSAQGEPPDIDDRAEWTVGRGEDTFCAESLDADPADGVLATQRAFFFDLDLYEPTAWVVRHIFPQLKEGDLVYSDETANFDERRAFLEHVGASPVPLTLIGATPMALASRTDAAPRRRRKHEITMWRR